MVDGSFYIISFFWNVFEWGRKNGTKIKSWETKQKFGIVGIEKKLYQSPLEVAF
jgi:hypothetical protein